MLALEEEERRRDRAATAPPLVSFGGARPLYLRFGAFFFFFPLHSLLWPSTQPFFWHCSLQ